MVASGNVDIFQRGYTFFHLTKMYKKLLTLRGGFKGREKDETEHL